MFFDSGATHAVNYFDHDGVVGTDEFDKLRLRGGSEIQPIATEPFVERCVERWFVVEAFSKGALVVFDDYRVGIPARDPCASLGATEHSKFELLIVEVARLINERTPHHVCLLYTSPSPRDGLLSRMPSSA